MRWKQSAWAIFVALIMGQAASPARAAGDSNCREFSAEKDGVILRASIPKPDVPWKDMVLRMNVINSTAKKIVYRVVYSSVGFRFFLTNERGEHLPLTERGRRDLQDFSHAEIGMNFTLELPPAGHLSFEEKLSDFFVLTEPGVYRLSVVWNSDCLYLKAPFNISLEINDIQFTVAKL